MLKSRALGLTKLFQQLNKLPKHKICQQVRNSGGAWSYRAAPAPPPRFAIIWAECGGGIMWWWILWHLWTESEHITGEWPIVEPLQWTDAELGIPPDTDGPGQRAASKN